MAAFTDDFNRADSSNLGGNYDSGGLGIASNKLVGAGSGVYAENRVTTSGPSNADYDVEIEFSANATGTIVLWARTTASYGSGRSGYNVAVDLAASTYSINRSNSEVDTALKATTSFGGVASTDKPGIRVQGSNISFIKNGTIVFTASDATHTGAGKASIGYYQPTGTSATFDNLNWADNAVQKSASDTASLTATESATDTVNVATLDTASLAVSESVTVASTLARTDTASISTSEASSLSVSNSGIIAASDTASLGAAEVSAVVVALSRNDTASLSTSETSSVATTLLSKTGADTASLSAADFAAVFVVGVTSKAVADVAFLSVEDASSRIVVNPPRSRNGGRIFIGKENRTIQG